MPNPTVTEKKIELSTIFFLPDYSVRNNFFIYEMKKNIPLFRNISRLKIKTNSAIFVYIVRLVYGINTLEYKTSYTRKYRIN